MLDRWRVHLEQQSANIIDGLVVDFGDPESDQNLAASDDTLSDLSHLDVLKISGSDAAEFLHGQLSSDVAALAEHESQLSSWCNIKGRVISSFLLYKDDDCFYLLLQSEMSENVIERLQMFIMRSDVSINNMSEELIPVGIRGGALHKQFQQSLDADTKMRPCPLIRLQDSVPRSIILCDIDQAIDFWQAISKLGSCTGSAHWARYDMQAGIPWVGKAGSEEFLPQSLNLDLLGALSFEKGCYPGQEIISRMHFRGKLKQRLFLARVALDRSVATGSRVYTSDLKQHTGIVVNAGRLAADCCLMLVILDLEYASSTSIHLDTIDGPALELLPQPHPMQS